MEYVLIRLKKDGYPDEYLTRWDFSEGRLYTSTDVAEAKMFFADKAETILKVSLPAKLDVIKIATGSLT